MNDALEQISPAAVPLCIEPGRSSQSDSFVCGHDGVAMAQTEPVSGITDATCRWCERLRIWRKNRMRGASSISFRVSDESENCLSLLLSNSSAKHAKLVQVRTSFDTDRSFSVTDFLHSTWAIEGPSKLVRTIRGTIPEPLPVHPYSGPGMKD